MLGVTGWERAGSAQHLREMTDGVCRNVQDDQQRCREVFRESRDQSGESWNATSRAADYHNVTLGHPMPRERPDLDAMRIAADPADGDVQDSGQREQTETVSGCSADSDRGHGLRKLQTSGPATARVPCRIPSHQRQTPLLPSGAPVSLKCETTRRRRTRIDRRDATFDPSPPPKGEGRRAFLTRSPLCFL
jgi:hypothetical protein